VTQSSLTAFCSYTATLCQLKWYSAQIKELKEGIKKYGNAECDEKCWISHLIYKVVNNGKQHQFKYVILGPHSNGWNPKFAAI
jgi:hypothetical protein